MTGMGQESSVAAPAPKPHFLAASQWKGDRLAYWTQFMLSCLSV